MNLRPSKTVITDNLGRRYEVVNGIKKELTQGLPFVIDEKPDMQISCIIHGLFLSSQDPAVSIEILKKYNIKHILSIGVSRSPTIVISYLMTLENISYDEAYEKVKSKRNCIKPNSGFVNQLKALNVSNLLERD
ncbi:PREDICTED: dual specificity phosphatase DUPD1 [Polistes canadensis]|uniref:dual specificity phosphatase DUPD1 n=1 Tax=Polistes canadensis TaxID=91411 RepID=UPI000718F0EB|nr:PREDICTED: dual specificity phosphatase DUPD1 [Polistes canadensis]